MPNPAPECGPPPLSVEKLAVLKNNPISASEALVAQPWLVGAKVELARINDEIQHLEALRTALLSPLEVYRVALAPHKLLPVDARVALDMLALWSDFRVEIYEHEPDWNTVDVLNTWLARSGQHSLSLEILNGDYTSTTKLVAEYSHRIHFLSLDSMASLVLLQPGSLDLLEDLCLESEDGPVHILPSSPSALLRATRLCTLTIGELEDEIHLDSVGIPWHQLTELSITQSPLSVLHYYYILEQCADLITAHIGILQLDINGPVLAAAEKITLPALRTLGLGWSSLFNYPGFLENFALPSLVDLLLIQGDFNKDRNSFIAPTFSTLQRLAIDDTAYGEDPGITSWLYACPSVVDVRIPHSVISSPMLTEITEESLLPHVEMLIAQGADPARANGEH
ncbi:hypothetical protein B0H17DRAFT_1199232 [Mycena rosella]|uniref:Uncharacterized protein n=1 Tax=Mycena rosella TaxID=1033263 RepID=A0AAD7GJY6_MYCRO|nr:hypothetical protein B0H17DRAFT_1199232 [Mycena rosella]